MNFIKKLFSLKGKTALITGASGGNGSTISYALVSAGAKIIITDKNANLLKKLSKQFKQKGLKSNSIVFDLTDENSYNLFSKEISKYSDKIDILVNNAGITNSYDSLNYPLEQWNATMNVNLKAPFLISRLVSKKFMKKGGSIINITSLAAEQGFPRNIAYVASKGGLKQLSKALSLDLAKKKIRVNCIGPGYFKTSMTIKSWKNNSMRSERTNRTILKRWGNPDDLMGLVIFLASDSSSYITGQDYYVDGGWLAKGL